MSVRGADATRQGSHLPSRTPHPEPQTPAPPSPASNRIGGGSFPWRRAPQGERFSIPSACRCARVPWRISKGTCRSRVHSVRWSFVFGSCSWAAGGGDRLVPDDPDVVEVSAEAAAGWGPPGRQKRKWKQVTLDGTLLEFLLSFSENILGFFSRFLSFPLLSCRLLVECSIEEFQGTVVVGGEGTAISVVVCDRLTRSGDAHVLADKRTLINHLW